MDLHQRDGRGVNLRSASVSQGATPRSGCHTQEQDEGLAMVRSRSRGGSSRGEPAVGSVLLGSSALRRQGTNPQADTDLVALVCEGVVAAVRGELERVVPHKSAAATPSGAFAAKVEHLEPPTLEVVLERQLGLLQKELVGIFEKNRGEAGLGNKAPTDLPQLLAAHRAELQHFQAEFKTELRTELRAELQDWFGETCADGDGTQSKEVKIVSAQAGSSASMESPANRREQPSMTNFLSFDNKPPSGTVPSSKMNMQPPQHLNPPSEEERERWYSARSERFDKVLNDRSILGRFKHYLESLAPEEAPEEPFAQFVFSNRFQTSCTLLIIANTIFIGHETNVGMQTALAGEEMPSYFRTVNIVFGILFSLELLIRTTALRSWWLLGPDWRWNFFDALLVALTLVQELLAGANVSFMRIFRIFRIVRVARVLRVVRFFRELRRMVFYIAACMGSLAWAFLLLLLITYVFAIFLIQGASGHLLDHPDVEIRDDLLYWYSDLPSAMFVLLLSISGGNDWWPMLEPLTKISKLYNFVFSFYVCFVVFGVLNVLTGIFLESATEFVDKDLVIQAQLMRADQFVLEMGSFFKEFDVGRKGHCDWETFEKALENDEVQAYLASLQLDCQDAYTLFSLLDRDGAHVISINEFIQGCLRLKGHARSIDTACLMTSIQQLSTQLQGVEARVGGQVGGVIGALSKKRKPRPPG